MSDNAFPPVAVIPNTAETDTDHVTGELFPDGDCNNMHYVVIDIQTGAIVGQVKMVMADCWRWARGEEAYPNPKPEQTMSTAVNALLISVLIGGDDA